MGFATLFGVCSSTSYWDQLSVSDREDLEALAIRDVLPAGETVIRQRGRSYSVLIILQGHVVVISEARSSAKMPADAAALAEIKNLPGVVQVELGGTELSVSANDLGTAAPRVLERLAARGFSCQELTSRRANLEDVFLALTGRTLRDT